MGNIRKYNPWTHGSHAVWTRWFVPAFLLLFILVSFFFLRPAKQTGKQLNRSSQLKKITVKQKDTETTTYVDNQGNKTMAADLGYCMVVRMRTEQGLLEKYYDEIGRPVSLSQGQFAVLNEYDQAGNAVRITFLDKADEPMMIKDGYAIAETIYDQRAHPVFIRYFGTDGLPTRTRLYGFGRNIEYDEYGQLRKITYVDDSGEPSMTALGYATVIRNYYRSEDMNNGKVESEFYFDANGQPVPLWNGQYGVHREYGDNGKTSIRTYLDANGNPIVTNKGYSSVQMTFSDDNSIITERYYDQEGKPVALSHGQYGIMNSDNQVLYLDQDGNQQINIRSILYTSAWPVIIPAVTMLLLSVVMNRKLNTVMLIMYITIILYLTLMYRDAQEGAKGVRLFRSYARILTDSQVRADILRNIWLFIPFGAILCRMFPSRKILVVPLVLSILIETVQLFSGLGYCEVDDVISNFSGATLGYAVSNVMTGIMKRKDMADHMKTRGGPVQENESSDADKQTEIQCN